LIPIRQCSRVRWKRCSSRLSALAIGVVFALLGRSDPADAQIQCFPIEVIAAQTGSFTVAWTVSDTDCPPPIEGSRFHVQVFKVDNYCSGAQTRYIEDFTDATQFTVPVDQANLYYQVIVTCNTTGAQNCPLAGVDSFPPPEKPTITAEASDASVLLNFANLDSHTAAWSLLRATAPTGPFTEICTDMFLNFCAFGLASGGDALNGAQSVRDYGPGCNATAPGQLPDGTYYYKVAAGNWGIAPFIITALPVQTESDVVSVVVGTPCAPLTAPELTVNGVQSTFVGAGDSYQLSWTAVPGASAYQLFRSVDGGAFGAFGAANPATGLTVSTFASDAGHSYVYTVRASASCGSVSQNSNGVAVAVLCATAVAPELTTSLEQVVAGDSITLRWNRTLSAGGSYLLRVKRDDRPETDLARVPDTQTSFVFQTTADDENHSFTFRVQADPGCAGGTSSGFSAPVTVAVLVACTQAPPSPASAEIQSHDGGPVTGVDFLDLSWSAVDPAPRQFRFMLNGGAEQSVDGSITSITVPPTGEEGREPTDPITLAVTAANDCGESEPAHAEVAPQPPTASFSPPEVDGLVATFTENSSPQATSWLWLFGDTSTPEAAHSVSHEYPAPGRYNVWLIASNGAGSSLATQIVEVGLAASSLTKTVARSFDSSDRQRQRLDRVEVAGPNRSWLVVTSREKVETIVFLHLKDSSGAIVLERRLSIQPEQEARFDLSAYGHSGTFAIEVVSLQKFTAVLEEMRPVREISLVPRRGPARTEDFRE
jgi:PKD repeat protein